MKNIFIALFFIFFYANAKAEVTTGFIKVAPGSISGFTNKENINIKKAFEIIEVVINSNEFKNKVINYKAAPSEFGFTSNREMNNTQVYEFLMNGQEVLGGDNTLGEMNFDMKRYWSSWFTRKVIGYTNIGKSNTIFGNGRKYQNFDSVDMASNITHEWIHLMGFYHDSAADHNSVPYAVGYIIRDLSAQYLKQGFLD